MEYLYLSISCFALGYLFGHRDLRYESILKSITEFKNNLLDNLKPRNKTVVLSSKDSYLPEKEEEDNNQ